MLFGVLCRFCNVYSVVIIMFVLAEIIPRVRRREREFFLKMLSITCYYAVSADRSFFYLFVLKISCII